MGPFEIEGAIEEIIEWEEVCNISHTVFGNLKDFKKDLLYVPNDPDAMCTIVLASGVRRSSRLTPDHVIPMGDDVINGYREETLRKGPYAVALMAEKNHHAFGPEQAEGKWKHMKTPLSPME